MIPPALSDLRRWLHENFGWEIYNWADGDIRF